MSYTLAEHSPRNRQFAVDYEYSVQVNRWLLKPIGAWPDTTTAVKNKFERALNYVLILTCHSLMAFTIIPCILYILFDETDIIAKLKFIGPLSHWLMGGTNYCFLLKGSKRIRQCLEHMEADWCDVDRCTDRQTMLKNAKIGRFTACFSAVCMYFGVSAYILLTSMKRIEVVIGNETLSIHPQTCPFYNKIVDSRFSPFNEIVFVMQIVSSCIVNSVTVGACGLAAVFAMHVCGQLDVLMSWLDEYVDDNGREYNSLQDKLAKLVEHHLRALRFVSQLEEVMQQICLVQLVGSTFNLCMLGYYFLTEWAQDEVGNATIYLIIMISMGFNIFIFCYIGESVAGQCKQVGEKAYMINWYQLPPKNALDLILLIVRSNVVVQITAGKLVKLSIATFATVVKTSMAYLNLLRTLIM